MTKPVPTTFPKEQNDTSMTPPLVHDLSTIPMEGVDGDPMESSDDEAEAASEQPPVDADAAELSEDTEMGEDSDVVVAEHGDTLMKGGIGKSGVSPRPRDTDMDPKSKDVGTPKEKASTTETSATCEENGKLTAIVVAAAAKAEESSSDDERSSSASSGSSDGQQQPFETEFLRMIRQNEDRLANVVREC